MINGEVGWLMYLRHETDAGFSSRNPNYKGSADAVIGYRLENGQHDYYPASWALPVEEVREALRPFKEQQSVPDWITWHDDCGTF